MRIVYTNKQIRYLLLTSFAVLFVGMGIFPILPLYASRFNASNSLIGIYFSIIYLSNTAAPMTAAWLAKWISKKTLLVASGLLGLPALALMATASSFTQVVIYTSILWFSGGIILSLVSIFAGLNTDERSRGNAFLILGLAAPLGSLAGGAATGKLIAMGGYTTLFIALTLWWVIVPLISFFGIKDARAPAAPKAAQVSSRTGKIGLNFYILSLLTLLATMSVSISRLGTTLSMQALNYSAEEVASTSVVSGLIVIPIILLIGTIAGRLGHRHTLTLGIMLSLAGSLLLFTATQLWQFWLAAVLHLMAFSVNGSMAQALSTNILQRGVYEKGLSWLNTSIAAANIIIFAVSGWLFENLGINPVFLVAALMALLSAAGLEALVHTCHEPAPRIQLIKLSCETEEIQAHA